MNSVFFINQKIGWVVGDSGVIFKTKNAGLTNWKKLNSGINYNLHSVKFLDTSNGWAVGDKGTIKKPEMVAIIGNCNQLVVLKMIYAR